MFKYKINIKRVSGRLNQSVLPSKNLVVNSKTRKSKRTILAEASRYFKKKYGLVIESAKISSGVENIVEKFESILNKIELGSNLKQFDGLEEIIQDYYDEDFFDDITEAKYDFCSELRKNFRKLISTDQSFRNADKQLSQISASVLQKDFSRFHKTIVEQYGETISDLAYVLAEEFSGLHRIVKDYSQMLYPIQMILHQIGLTDVSKIGEVGGTMGQKLALLFMIFGGQKISARDIELVIS